MLYYTTLCKIKHISVCNILIHYAGKRLEKHKLQYCAILVLLSIKHFNTIHSRMLLTLSVL